MKFVDEKKVSNRLYSDQEHGFELTKLRVHACTHNMDDSNWDCNQEISTTSASLAPQNEFSSESPRDMTDGANVTDALVTHNCVVVKDMLKESLELVYQQLEEMKQNNATQFRDIVEKNNEKCKETEKRIEKIIRKGKKL